MGQLDLGGGVQRDADGLQQLSADLVLAFGGQLEGKIVSKILSTTNFNTKTT